MAEPTTTIYGSSDDLVELEGGISGEFTVPDDSPCGTGALLAFSDGTVLDVAYTDDGVWRIRLVKEGRSDYSNVQAPVDDEGNYSDRATLVGPLDWCVLGTDLAPTK